MEDNELARRKDLGLTVERIRKNRILHHNGTMAGLNAYCKVFHLPGVHYSRSSYDRVRQFELASFVN